MRTRQRNLGNRRVCSSCGTKYYDLERPEPSCPRCGAPAYAEEEDPRAAAMARIKAEGPRRRRPEEDEEEEALPFGLGDDPDLATDEDEDDMDELGELTDETSADDDYDFE